MYCIVKLQNIINQVAKCIDLWIVNKRLESNSNFEENICAILFETIHLRYYFLTLYHRTYVMLSHMRFLNSGALSRTDETMYLQCNFHVGHSN